jgi:hypothetical protein
MKVMDTNSNVTLHLPQIIASGYTAIGRYYSSNARKRLTSREARAISDAGIELFAVFEDGARPELSRPSGLYDGQLAIQQAKDVGQPQGTAIYFGLDSDLAEDDLPGVRHYFVGVADAIAGEYKLGVYGDGVVCQALLDENIANSLG